MESKLGEIFATAYNGNSTRSKLFKTIANLETVVKQKRFTSSWYRQMFQTWVLKSLRYHARRGLTELKPHTLPGKMKDLMFYASLEGAPPLTEKLRYHLNRWAKAVAVKISDEFVGSGTQQARPLLLQDGLKLSRELRHNGPKTSEQQSRKAGLMLKMCLYSGARLGDYLRLRWRDIKISRNFKGLPAISIYIKSKGDPLGARKDRKTIFIGYTFRLAYINLHLGHPKEDKYNPVYWLLEDSRGSAADDYVFPKLKNQRYCNQCMSGNDFRYQYRLAAERLNWNFVPTGHSARNAAVATLALGGASDTALKVFFNWSSDSKMVKSYIRSNLEKSSKSCAHLWQTLIMEGQVEKLQKQISI